MYEKRSENVQGGKQKMMFSIIVPFCNTPHKMIEELINQLSSLDKKFFEVIFVNDGSNEETSKFVEEKTKDFKYLSYQPNHGVSYARNLGIKESNGEFLLFVDSDDLVNLDLLKCVSSLSKKDLLIFISDIFYTTINEKRNNIEEVVFDKQLDEIYSYCDIKGIAMRSACGKVFKKQILIDNNIYFDEDLPFYEDAMFVSKYYEHVDSFSVYSNILYHYRMNPKSSSKKFNKLYMKKYEVFFNKYKNEFGNNKNYILALYSDAFGAVLTSKVVGAFKKWHYLLATKICKNSCIIEAADYLLKNNLLNTKYKIKLASLIINRHNILAANKIISHQIFGSLKIRLGKIFK